MDVTLKVYTPDGCTLLAESTAHLIATYLTPTASNSRLTMSVRAGADGRVRLGNGDDIVLGVTSLQYASPETRVVWEVNGKEASRDHSFTFRPDADGTYVISVTVNDIRIGAGRHRSRGRHRRREESDRHRVFRRAGGRHFGGGRRHPPSSS